MSREDVRLGSALIVAFVVIVVAILFGHTQMLEITSCDLYIWHSMQSAQECRDASIDSMMILAVFILAPLSGLTVISLGVYGVIGALYRIVDDLEEYSWKYKLTQKFTQFSGMVFRVVGSMKQYVLKVKKTSGKVSATIHRGLFEPRILEGEPIIQTEYVGVTSRPILVSMYPRKNFGQQFGRYMTLSVMSSNNRVVGKGIEKIREVFRRLFENLAEVVDAIAEDDF